MNLVELPARWFAAHTEWLSTRIYESSFFTLDLWSGLHFGLGFVLFGLLAGRQSRYPYWKLLGLLLAGHFLVAAFAPSSFLPLHLEMFTAHFSDLVVGMTGGVGAAQLLRLWNRLALEVDGNARRRYRFTACLASPALAFVWVGSYGYQYNVGILCSQGLNWFAWGLWTLGHLVIIEFNLRLKERIAVVWLRLALLWLCYFICLLTIEFVGYYLLGIHEVGHPPCTALIVGLIHGTPVLFGFYLTAPFWSLAAQQGLQRIFRSATRAPGEEFICAPVPALAPVLAPTQHK